MVKEPLDPKHPLSQLLHSVNPHWTRGQLWRATETYLGIWGKAYWLIDPERGAPQEVWPMRPDRMKPIRHPTEYIAGYIYRAPGGKETAYLPDEVVRFVYFNPLDEFEGLSPLAPLRLSADLGFDALKANRAYLSNDASPGIFIENQDDFDDAQLERFYRAWDERYKGPTKSGRPAMLTPGMKPSRLGLSPAELQHLETLRWSLGDVARAYGVPLPILHELSRATYSNIATARLSFWQDTMIPQLIFHQEVLAEYLLPRFGDPELIVEFDLTQIEVLQESENDRAERQVKYVTAGIKTPNEVRAELGLQQSPEPEADQLALAGPQPAFPQFEATGRPRALRRGFQGEEIGRLMERAFLLELGPRERKFTVALRELFRQQLRSMLAVLDDGRSLLAPSTQRAWIYNLGEAHASRAEPRNEDTAVLGGLRLFVPEEWEAPFADMARPQMQSALGASAKAAAAQFELSLAFDVNKPITQEWLTTRSKWWAGQANEYTGQMVTAAVKKANEAGWSVAELSDALEHTVGEFNDQVRAHRVARTEMASAQNEGHLQMYGQAELPGKQWLTSVDGRERETHAEAHLQIRRLEADFDVGGYKLRAPAQGGPAKEIVNCRCVALPRFEIIEETV